MKYIWRFNMNKIIFAFALGLFFLTGCDNQTKAENQAQTASEQSAFSENKIYFFYSNYCPHCHEALKYINAKHPNLEFTMVNVENPGGFKLLLQAVKEYKIGGSAIGTPLLLMGKNYLMGWAPEYETQFENYLKPFAK